MVNMNASSSEPLPPNHWIALNLNRSMLSADKSAQNSPLTGLQLQDDMVIWHLDKL